MFSGIIDSSPKGIVIHARSGNTIFNNTVPNGNRSMIYNVDA
ncbi:MAG: hypothetical protein IJQ68_06850 [Methanobrevibacter sp.]|nr:hypothetical protein [Methanobrevibacter sp.]